MKVLKFINNNKENWKELLSKAPYYITIKEDEPYYLLKYNQLDSDNGYEIVRECRGCIIRYDMSKDEYICVCRPFDRFFNYNDPHAAEIDWKTAKVREKIDGSLIKFWCDTYGLWHMSTNGSIDAFKAEISDNPYGLTFGNIVERALGCNWLSFCRELNPEYTYMFEVISPDTRVTVPYEYDGLYYLGQRHRGTMIEEYNYDSVWRNFGIYEPKVYHLSSLDDCISLVDEFTKDEEGVVVSDDNFNRIKVKSPAYLIAAHAANNGKLGLRTAIRLIREDKVDDFLAYAPMHRAKMEIIIAAYEDIRDHFYDEFSKVRHIVWMPKKEFVYGVQLAKLTKDGFNFAMWAYDHRENNINDYMNLLTERSLIQRIKERVKDELEVEDNE